MVCGVRSAGPPRGDTPVGRVAAQVGRGRGRARRDWGGDEAGPRAGSTPRATVSMPPSVLLMRPGRSGPGRGGTGTRPGRSTSGRPPRRTGCSGGWPSWPPSWTGWRSYRGSPGGVRAARHPFVSYAADAVVVATHTESTSDRITIASIPISSSCTGTRTSIRRGAAAG